jgi:transposase InsO family protein
MGHKSEFFSKFIIFKKCVETFTKLKVQVLRTNRGGKFTSHEFNIFCEKHGIKMQFTTTNSPHQNGVAQRKNITILDRARCIALTN